jgi:hypothetical protein
MLSRIRKQLTFANVMASVAVFAALGGGAYAVASGKIGPKQIQKGAIKTSKLHKGAVTAGKVKNDTLTGKQINESTLGTVPNSSKVNGSQVIQVSYRQPEGSAPQTLFSLAGLTVTASCPAGTDVVLDATTDTNGSIIGLSQIGAGVDDTFDAGEHQTFGLDDFQGDLSYGKGPTGSPEVSAVFLANKFNSTSVCSVVGTVTGG